jgi:hypothetical protein
LFRRGSNQTGEAVQETFALATGTEAMKPSGLPSVVIDTWATSLAVRNRDHQCIGKARWPYEFRGKISVVTTSSVQWMASWWPCGGQLRE